MDGPEAPQLKATFTTGRHHDQLSVFRLNIIIFTSDISDKNFFSVFPGTAGSGTTWPASS